MTEEHFTAFRQSFDRLCATFRVRLKPVQANDLCRSYFQVLEGFPLDEVLTAGKACLSKSRTFPRPAQWLAELSVGAAIVVPADRRVMTIHEVAELAEAERLRYTGNLCHCQDCYRAGVDDKEMRFVPTLVGDEEERAFHPTRKQVTVVGHWAHGEELARWYQTRGVFFALISKQPRFSRALALVAREPGQEG